MKATFHLSAELDVVVFPDPSGAVVLELRQGVDYEGNGNGVKIIDLPLLKSQARAIASALMACAAEL